MLAPREIEEQQESPTRVEIAEDVSFQECAIIRLYRCSTDASSTICANFFEAFLEFREVRSCPINLVAACATAELFVVDFRKRFESLNYFGLGNLSQRCVAAKATGKWGDRTKKIKTANYFHGLFVGVL